ncbi:hypothetical protein ACLB2K_020639 [Fragaria x ananassa]
MRLCFGSGKPELVDYTSAVIAEDDDLRKSTSGPDYIFRGSCLLEIKATNGIPKRFSDEHLSPGQYEFSLKNGKPWEVKVLENRGRLFISAGWRAFAVASQIKLRDKCTFELVGEKRMVVHICSK